MRPDVSRPADGTRKAAQLRVEPATSTRLQLRKVISPKCFATPFRPTHGRGAQPRHASRCG